MSKIFDKISINGMTLRNRLVRSATWEGMCEQNGRPTEKLAGYYRDLAKGGVGLIITGYTYVREEGKQNPGKMGLYNGEFSNYLFPAPITCSRYRHQETPGLRSASVWEVFHSIWKSQSCFSNTSIYCNICVTANFRFIKEFFFY